MNVLLKQYSYRDGQFEYYAYVILKIKIEVNDVTLLHIDLYARFIYRHTNIICYAFIEICHYNKHIERDKHTFCYFVDSFITTGSSIIEKDINA